MDISTLTAFAAAAKAEIDGILTERERAELISKLPMIENEKDYRNVMESFKYFHLMKSSLLSSAAEDIDLFYEGKFEDISENNYKTFEGLFHSVLLSYKINPEGFEFPEISRELAEAPTRVGAEIEERAVIEEAIEAEPSYEPGAENIPIIEDEAEKEEALTAREEVEAVEEVEEAEGPEDKVESLRSILGDGWINCMYQVIQARVSGMGDEDLWSLYGNDIEEMGAVWASFLAIADDIIKDSQADGYNIESWTDETVPEEYVKAKFYDTRFKELCVRPEVADAAGNAVRKAVLSYGSRGVESYIMTDSDLEDKAAFYVKGKKTLRLFTSSEAYGQDLKPAKFGIFSEELLGPPKYGEGKNSQVCMCGKCNKENSAIDAGTTCPECGYPVMSSADRDKTYGLIESPFPLLMGRGGLVSMMIAETSLVFAEGGKAEEKYLSGKLSMERIVKLLEEGGGAEDCCVFKSDGEWKIGIDIEPSTGTEVLHGTEAIETMLAQLAGKTKEYNGKIYPLAVVNALENLRLKAGRIERTKTKDSEWDARRKKYALEDYNRSLNYFSTICATLIDRNGNPEDFLLHYIPVPPVTTRLPNDRNGSSDYGEDNKLFMSLIRQRNAVEKIREAGKVSENKWLAYERAFFADVKKLTSFNNDSFYNKNGRLYRKLMSTRADDCIRSVISPSDNVKGQGWLRLESGGELDIPAMDLIGLPRSGLRTMYKKEIKARLKKMGYSDEAVTRAFEVPAGTMEKTEEGQERRCLVDRVLDEVLLNRDPETRNARGRMVMYMRHPVITDGSVQTGYVYPVDHDAIEFPIARCKAMNADFDGDTGLAVKMEAPDRDPETGKEYTLEEKKAYTEALRAELKRHMDTTVLDRGTGELLVAPRLEALYGLYKATGPVETYTFKDKVIVCEDELEKLKAEGILNDETGRLRAQASIFVNHVIDELSPGEVAAKLGEIIPAGTVYGTRGGRPLVAEEAIKLARKGSRIYAVTPLNDYIRVPKGAVITDKRVLEPGDKLCIVKPVIFDRAAILSGFKTGQFTYNQPVYTLDGVLTTPGRLAVENVFGHKLAFKDTGYNSKDWEKILIDEINTAGMEQGKKIISTVTRLGFAINTLLGERIKAEQFPTTQPISHEQIYDPSDREKAHRMAYGHNDIVLEGCTVKNNLKTWKGADSLPLNTEEDSIKRVWKGWVYGWGPDRKPLVAEYDMVLFKKEGDQWYTARDMVMEDGDFRDFMKNRDAVLLIQERMKGGMATPDDAENLKKAMKQTIRAYAKMNNRRKHLKATYINEFKVARYEMLREQVGQKVVQQLSRYKNNPLWDSIKAGVKKEDLAISMVAIGTTKDYAGDYLEPVLGSLTYGLSGDMRIMNEVTAIINGNKTLYVDIIGAIGNMIMAALEGYKYEKGDCGTTEYRVIPVPEDAEEIKKLGENLEGRTVAADIITSEGELLASKGDVFSKALVADAYHKGIKSLPQRSAAYCRCRGTCEACAGKMRGVIPEYGSELGFSAKNSLVSPFSQGTMSRAKAAGGGKMENGAEVLMNLVSGAYMRDLKEGESIKDFIEEFSDSFFNSGKIKVKDFPPVFAELIAKALVYYNHCGLASTVARAVENGEDLSRIGSECGFVNYEAGKLQNTFMSYMAKDRTGSKMGAFGGRGKETPKVRSNTMYREKYGLAGRAV